MVYHIQTDDNNQAGADLLHPSLLALSTAALGAGFDASSASPAAAVGWGGSAMDLEAQGNPRVTTTTPAMEQAHVDAARTLAVMPSVGPAAAAAAPVAAGSPLIVEGATASDVPPTPAAAAPAPAPAAAPAAVRLFIDPPFVFLPATRDPRPLLVVGPGQFGGQAGLLRGLHPPELTKYLTVSVCVCGVGGGLPLFFFCVLLVCLPIYFTASGKKPYSYTEDKD